MIQRRVVFQQSVVFIKYSSGFGDGRTARDGIVIRRAETYCIIYVMIFFFRQAAVYVRVNVAYGKDCALYRCFLL